MKIGDCVSLKQNDYNLSRQRNGVFDGAFAPGFIGIVAGFIEGRPDDYMLLVPGYDEYPFYFYANEFELVP